MACAARKKGKDAQAAPEVVPAEVSAAVHAWDGSIQQLVTLSEQVRSPIWVTYMKLDHPFLHAFKCATLAAQKFRCVAVCYLPLHGLR